MPRLPLPDLNDLPPENRELLGYLPDLNVFKAMAASGAVFPAFMSMANAFLNDGTLDAQLRELVILRVGNLSGSRYEVHHHERVAKNEGIDAARIEATKSSAEAEVFSDQERAVLRFTDDVVHNVKASDAIYQAVQKYFSDQQLLELTTLIGFYMLVCRMLETFEVALEEGPPPEGDLGMIKRSAHSLRD